MTHNNPAKKTSPSYGCWWAFAVCIIARAYSHRRDDRELCVLRRCHQPPQQAGGTRVFLRQGRSRRSPELVLISPHACSFSKKEDRRRRHNRIRSSCTVVYLLTLVRIMLIPVWGGVKVSSSKKLITTSLTTSDNI